ncbi:MAG: PcfJ domain-containing protein [Intestinimonas sp.]|jgi:predicted RNA-binding Zn-ribbon protein involved in translation (DUF1610 family)|nr:PcfJ domain-containing protein [Intestinimonas sp.]
MKIPKNVKAMPWPEDIHSGNEDYRVSLSWPVAEHERLLVVTFLVNRNKAVGYGRTAQDAAKNFRLICFKKQNRAVILYQGERQGKRHRLRPAMRQMRTDPRTCYPRIDERDEAALAKWLGRTETQNHFLDHLENWVDQALNAEKQAEADARGELRDEDVDLCPGELPEGLEEWVRREIIGRDHTLVYKKGNVRGVCFRCGRKVHAGPWQRFRQFSITRCPDCGEEVICVLSRTDHFRAEYVKNIVAAQLGTDGKTVFFRQWHVKRDPTARYEQVAPWLEEFGRYAVRGNRAAKWLHEYKENYCMNAYRYRMDVWTRFSGVEVYDGSYEFFEGSLEGAVAGTRLQYADIPGYHQTSWTQYRDGGYGYHNVVRYAMDWARYPVMEFLWKAGYKNLVFQRVAGLSKENRNAVRWSRGKLKECFKFPLRLLKLKPADQWNMEDVQKLTKLWGYHELGSLAERDISEMLEMDLHFDLLENAMAYAPLRKIIKYLSGQTEAHHGNLEQTYRDYIQECGQLRLDLHSREILFPRDLQEAHNRTMAQISYQKNKADQEKFAAQVKKLERWAWERGALLIRPARAQKELSDEGAALHHCVGGYIQRVANGETAIFFVRKKAEPEKPYFTLELRDKRVIQCRTKNNKSYELVPEIRNFVVSWLEERVNKKAGRAKKKTAHAA